MRIGRYRGFRCCRVFGRRVSKYSGVLGRFRERAVFFLFGLRARFRLRLVFGTVSAGVYR